MGPLVLLAAAVSGAAALVAEVVWFRALGRGVGTSAEALAVVSASFLGGLGIGAAIAGRRAPRTRAPLRAAAICEAVAGVLVVASPFVLDLVPDAHLALLHAFGWEPGPSAWPAALVAMPILLLPTSFLGATLPFLVRSRVARTANAGRWTGALYSVNTVGAAAGVALAVLFLLETFGERTALRFAGCGNLAAALLLLLAYSPSAPPLVGDAVPASAPAAPPVPGARAARAALFLTGVAALGGEVAWFRLLEPLTGTHIYGFAILLGAVLVGTAAGGAAGGSVADRVRRPDLALAAAVCAAGVLTLASVWAAGNVPWLSMASGGTGRGAAAGALRAKLLVSGLCVAAPLAAFALAYPIAVRSVARSPATAAAESGRVYAWNTAGNVAGSLGAGFVLVPLLGGARTLAVLGGICCLGAAFLWLRAPRPRRPLGAVILALPVVPLVWPGALDAVERAGPSLPEVVVANAWSGTYRVRSRADARAISEMVGGTFPRPPGRPDAPPVRPRDGVVGGVGILLEKDTPRLRQGGLAESKFQSADPDAGSETEVALALVPYLCHPSPKKALVIGHGAGWTCETLLAAEDLERVDVAEIEPAVLDVVAAYRGPLEVRHNPRAHLLLADGRLLLRESAAQGGIYDLVVSQPSHPWVPGAGHLFTREAYALARKALAPRGIFAQWLNVFDMNRELFLSALAAWRSSFPDSWLLLYNEEIVLVGFASPPHLDAARWERVLAGPGVGARARAAGIRGPEDVLRRWTADGDGLARLVPPDHPAASDDDARLEVGLAWRRLVRPSDRVSQTNALQTMVRGVFPPGVEKALQGNPSAVRHRWVARTVQRLVDAGTEADVALARRWDDSVSYDGGAEGRRARALEVAASAEHEKLSGARLRAATKRAEELLRSAIDADPSDARPVLSLVDFLIKAQRAADAVDVARAAASRLPDDGRVLAALGRALVEAGNEPEADSAFGRALAARSPRAPAGTGELRSRLLLTLATPRTKDARDALRADPGTEDDLEALRSLHRLELEVASDGQTQDEAEIQRLEARLDALEKARGRQLVARARYWIDRDAARGLEASREATQLLPDWAEAWEVRGWFELWSDVPDSAASSLRKALSLAKDPSARRETLSGWMRAFGGDPASLDAKEEP
jgi:spermidine synthase